MKFFSKENAAKQALAQSILAVVTIDEKNNITFYNDAAQKLWGYTPNEVLGKNIKLLVPTNTKQITTIMLILIDKQMLIKSLAAREKSN